MSRIKGMTREEAIAKIGHIIDCIELGIFCGEDEEVFEALDLALAALRGPTREMAERMRGEWEPFGGKYISRKKCSRCGWDGQEHIKFYSWCPACGAPMTDEAVEMVMERLEALKDD